MLMAATQPRGSSSSPIGAIESREHACHAQGARSAKRPALWSDSTTMSLPWRSSSARRSRCPNRLNSGRKLQLLVFVERQRADFDAVEHPLELERRVAPIELPGVTFPDDTLVETKTSYVAYVRAARQDVDKFDCIGCRVRAGAIGDDIGDERRRDLLAGRKTAPYLALNQRARTHAHSCPHRSDARHIGVFKDIFKDLAEHRRRRQAREHEHKHPASHVLSPRPRAYPAPGRTASRRDRPGEPRSRDRRK